MTCKWCLCIFDVSSKPKNWLMNHCRWCDKNPNKQSSLDKLKERNLSKLMLESKRISGITNQFTKAKFLGKTVTNKLKGKTNTALLGRKHSEISKYNMRQGCLKSNHRRLRKSCVIYKGVKLDSSWELELAKRLDEKNIKWVRPDPIKWKDSFDMEHNYFPDFYLIDYDLYLDPKNPHAYFVQKSKIEILLNTYKNLVFLKTLEECKNFSL